MLEEEIKLLREAVQELTATLKNNSFLSEPKHAPLEIKTPEPEPAPEPAPAPEGEVSERDVADLTLAKSRDGHRNAIKAKLDEMGKARVSLMDQSELAEFKKFLEAL